MALVAQRGISVILPAYNEEDNIAKAVEQAVQCVKALFQDWEVIVVNDGSRDKTGKHGQDVLYLFGELSGLVC